MKDILEETGGLPAVKRERRLRKKVVDSITQPNSNKKIKHLWKPNDKMKQVAECQVSTSKFISEVKRKVNLCMASTTTTVMVANLEFIKKVTTVLQSSPGNESLDD